MPMRMEELAVQHRTVMANGIRIHYVELGQGPLVLLLHGFPEFWWSWRHQLEPLAKAGYRVVAPDLRGYNETSREGPYDLDTVTRDVAELIGALGESKASVIAHDWGGAVGWHLAAHHPGKVERLAVLNCPHPAMMTRALTHSPRQIRKSWYIFAFQLPVLPERRLVANDAVNLRRMYRSMAKDVTHFADEEIAPFRAAIQQSGAATATIGWYRAAGRAALKRAPRYPPIEAPVLLAWAMDDRALDYEALVPGTERYASKLRVERIYQCGHFLQAEKPEVVNRLLAEFLAST